MEVGYLILLIMFVLHLQQVNTACSQIDMIVHSMQTSNFSSNTANCGDPSQPSDGYLEIYTSTSLGARVNIVHMCQNGLLATEEIVCSLNGEWETVNGSSCSVNKLTQFCYYSILTLHLLDTGLAHA